MSFRNLHDKRNLLGTFLPTLLLVSCYLLLIIPFTSYMRSKPFVERLGHFPRVEVLQFVSADQKQLVAASLVMKVMMYFGGLMEQDLGKFKLPPDNPAMSRIIHGAVKLDPYNMDAYYFAQGILVWDVGAYKVANDLLVYGMKYRTWDWYLPFFAGFNSAYFLKDYASAAKYYRMAGDLSGEALFTTLAGRYMQKSGQTDLAIVYLSIMEKSARNKSIKKTYEIRLQALRAVRSIEIARDSYLTETGKAAASVEELVQRGYLAKTPQDPYGGKFLFEADGKVVTTSDFTFGKKSEMNKNQVRGL